MGPHDKEVLDARVYAVECFYSNWGDLREAIAQFESGWNAKHERKIADVRSFIELWAENFKKRNSVKDAGGQGRGQIMPDAAVLEIAEIIRQGYTQHCSFVYKGQQLDYIEHLRFTSLSDAISYSQRIRDLMDQHPSKGDEHQRAKYVLRRLHEVVPTLVYSHLPVKRPLSDDDREWRAEYAEVMCDWLEIEPDILDDFFWADECICWLNMHETNKLMVWFDKRDVYGHPPGENAFCSREGGLKVEIILIVSARHGCVWVEFLTGTTDLAKDGYYNQSMRDNMAMREQLGLGCYKTKDSNYTTPAKRATAWEIGDNLMCGYFPKRYEAYQQGREPFISIDNPKIHEVSPQFIDLSRDRFPLPPRSFDLHQAIEHRFAGLKHHIIVEVYKMTWLAVKAAGAPVLRKIVTDYCEQQITPEVVKADCKNLKNLYKVLACPTDQSVSITMPGATHARQVQGTRGGYPINPLK